MGSLSRLDACLWTKQDNCWFVIHGMTECNGEFITKFGASGTERGKLNMPISTAVLSDGRVIVTEFHNHRVQVFE